MSSFSSCAHCKNSTVKFQCQNCPHAYCNRECAKKQWPIHQKICGGYRLIAGKRERGDGEETLLLKTTFEDDEDQFFQVKVNRSRAIELSPTIALLLEAQPDITVVDVTSAKILPNTLLMLKGFFEYGRGTAANASTVKEIVDWLNFMHWLQFTDDDIFSTLSYLKDYLPEEFRFYSWDFDLDSVSIKTFKANNYPSNLSFLTELNPAVFALLLQTFDHIGDYNEDRRINQLAHVTLSHPLLLEQSKEYFYKTGLSLFPPGDFIINPDQDAATNLSFFFFIFYLVAGKSNLASQLGFSDGPLRVAHRSFATYPEYKWGAHHVYLEKIKSDMFKLVSEHVRLDLNVNAPENGREVLSTILPYIGKEGITREFLLQQVKQHGFLLLHYIFGSNMKSGIEFIKKNF